MEQGEIELKVGQYIRMVKAVEQGKTQMTRQDLGLYVAKNGLYEVVTEANKRIKEGEVFKSGKQEYLIARMKEKIPQYSEWVIYD